MSRGKGDSCGVGINETVRRSWQERYCVRVADMLSPDRLTRILREYAPARCKELGIEPPIEDYWLDVFHVEAERFLSSVHVTSRPPGQDFVFEGAQGLLLDQNAADFPFVTHSNTGLKNVLALCRDMAIENVRATYVTRSYLTRHGAGPLPHEEPMPAFVVDHTNVPHPFQGALRYAPLDVLGLERRVIKDAGDVPINLAVTCLDQTGDAILKQFTVDVRYASYGPTREDVVVRTAKQRA
jgi:adenylosuccinate synthase